MPVASRTLRPICAAILVAVFAFPPLMAAEKAPPPPQDPTGASLEALLAGEFALQSGRLDEAAQAYLEAAREADDVALAERATRIARSAANGGTSAGSSVSLPWARTAGMACIRATAVSWVATCPSPRRDIAA